MSRSSRNQTGAATFSAMQTLKALRDHADEHGRVTLTDPELAAITGFSTRSVQYAIRYWKDVEAIVSIHHDSIEQPRTIQLAANLG